MPDDLHDQMQSAKKNPEDSLEIPAVALETMRCLRQLTNYRSRRSAVPRWVPSLQSVLGFVPDIHHLPRVPGHKMPPIRVVSRTISRPSLSFAANSGVARCLASAIAPHQWHVRKAGRPARPGFDIRSSELAKVSSSATKLAERRPWWVATW